MDDFMRLLNNFLALSYVPTLIAALVTLAAGWVVALIASAIVRRALERIGKLPAFARLGGDSAGSALKGIPGWAGRLVFWLVLLFTLMAFFQLLGLTPLTQPLNQLLTAIFAYAPGALGAAMLALVAWVVASVLRAVVTQALVAARVDERTGAGDGQGAGLSSSVGEATYWLVFLLFLPAILTALGLTGLLVPVQGMIDSLLGFLPNILGAAIIFIVGLMVARILRRIVTSLLAAMGADSLGSRVGLAPAMGALQLSSTIGLVVYVLVLIPVVTGALEALQLRALTQPATNMLNVIFSALPAVVAASVILLVSYVIGRLVSTLATSLLTGIGFDALLERLGMGAASAGDRTLSQIAGGLVFVGIMFFAAIEALELLQFGLLAGLLTQFTALAGQVLLGLVLLGVAIFLGNLAFRTIGRQGAPQAGLLGHTARLAILFLGGAMALRQMGLANEIITLGFGLITGAVAVAAAIAFGLGGRDVAARQLDEWVTRLKQN